MSYWDSEAQKIVQMADEPWDGYPAWERIDCGCCAGIAWGGWSPEECRQCGGGGFLARHRTSRVLAEYPGGPLRGHDRLASAIRAEGDGR